MPFRKYNLEERKKDVFSLRLNDEERAKLEEDKRILRQPKDSTAVKMLMKIGHFVIHEPKIKEIVNTIFENNRKNEKTGLTEF